MENKIINNYCLYYIPKSSEGLSDVLMIYFGENKNVTKREIKDNLILLKKEEELIGVVIVNFSYYAKIKINGTIFLPNSFLLNVINNVLINVNIELLEKENSGFIIGETIKKEEVNKMFRYEVSLGNKVINTESSFDIPLNSLVVIALENTYLMPQRMIFGYRDKDGYQVNGRICTYEDLQMEVENAFLPILIYEDSLSIGQDFFLTEEKVDA